MHASDLLPMNEGHPVVPEIGGYLDVQKMPAHWLMARLGKRVLRPGGIGLTRWLLQHARLRPEDDVIELATGLGRTAALILSHRPRTYTGIERDAQAVRMAERAIAPRGVDHAHVVRGNAASVPLADGVASLVVGEAMLSMQPAPNKRAIMNEAFRLLRPGGRYVIHELAVTRETVDAPLARIQEDLSRVLHVGVRVGTMRDWTHWLADAGFTIEQMTTTPMRLLECDQMIGDEGLLGALRFAFNAVCMPGVFRRLRIIRGVFRRHQHQLCAVGIIAVRNTLDVAGRPSRGSIVLDR